jgi:hypothetical protein
MCAAISVTQVVLLKDKVEIMFAQNLPVQCMRLYQKSTFKRNYKFCLIIYVCITDNNVLWISWFRRDFDLLIQPHLSVENTFRPSLAFRRNATTSQYIAGCIPNGMPNIPCVTFSTERWGCIKRSKSRLNHEIRRTLLSVIQIYMIKQNL